MGLKAKTFNPLSCFSGTQQKPLSRHEDDYNAKATGKKRGWFSGIKRVLLPQSKTKLTVIREVVSPTSEEIFPRHEESTLAAAYGDHCVRRSTEFLEPSVGPRRFVTGDNVKRQVTSASKHTQLFVRVQTQIRSRRINKMLEKQAQLHALLGNDKGISTRSALGEWSLTIRKVVSPTSQEIFLRPQENTVVAAYRDHCVRRSIEFLEPSVRPKRFVMGDNVRRQVTSASKHTQLFVRVQTQIRSRRINTTLEKQAPRHALFGNDNVKGLLKSFLAKEETLLAYIDVTRNDHQLASSLDSPYYYILHDGAVVVKCSGNLASVLEAELVERQLDVIKVSPPVTVSNLPTRPRKEDLEFDQFWELFSQRSAKLTEKDPNPLSSTFSNGVLKDILVKAPSTFTVTKICNFTRDDRLLFRQVLVYVVTEGNELPFSLICDSTESVMLGNSLQMMKGEAPNPDVRSMFIYSSSDGGRSSGAPNKSKNVCFSPEQAHSTGKPLALNALLAANFENLNPRNLSSTPLLMMNELYLKPGSIDSGKFAKSSSVIAGSFTTLFEQPLLARQVIMPCSESVYLSLERDSARGSRLPIFSASVAKFENHKARTLSTPPSMVVRHLYPELRSSDSLKLEKSSAIASLTALFDQQLPPVQQGIMRRLSISTEQARATSSRSLIFNSLADKFENHKATLSTPASMVVRHLYPELKSSDSLKLAKTSAVSSFTALFDQQPNPAHQGIVRRLSFSSTEQARASSSRSLAFNALAAKFENPSNVRKLWNILPPTVRKLYPRSDSGKFASKSSAIATSFEQPPLAPQVIMPRSIEDLLIDKRVQGEIRSSKRPYNYSDSLDSYLFSSTVFCWD